MTDAILPCLPDDLREAWFLSEMLNIVDTSVVQWKHLEKDVAMFQETIVHGVHAYGETVVLTGDHQNQQSVPLPSCLQPPLEVNVTEQTESADIQQELQILLPPTSHLQQLEVDRSQQIPQEPVQPVPHLQSYRQDLFAFLQRVIFHQTAPVTATDLDVQPQVESAPLQPASVSSPLSAAPQPVAFISASHVQSPASVQASSLHRPLLCHITSCGEVFSSTDNKRHHERTVHAWPDPYSIRPRARSTSS